MNILKLDLDIKTKQKAILHLQQRLEYIISLRLFNLKLIKKIELIKKKTYGCKIYLKSELADELKLICFQLLLGSDYRKEAFVIARHFLHKVEYSNRLYDIKQYPNDKILISKRIDITKDILEYFENIKQQQKLNKNKNKIKNKIKNKNKNGRK